MHPYVFNCPYCYLYVESLTRRMPSTVLSVVQRSQVKVHIALINMITRNGHSQNIWETFKRVKHDFAIS